MSLDRFRLDLEQPRVQRILQAVAIGFGIAFAILSYHGGLIWTDGRVYWEAGERVASGLPMYPADAEPDTAYKYAPWFAWVWSVATWLPEPLVAAVWTAAMLGSWALPVLAYLGLGWRGRALVFLAAPPLLIAALGGNVQPAVVALLFAGLDRRWGPIAIGIAASLKLFPLLFAIVYLARREWLRAATAGGLSAVLWLPVLALDFGAYPAEIGGAFSLWQLSPLVYVATLLAAATWVWLRRTWPPASVLVIVGASVRFIPYHLGYLLAAPPPNGWEGKGPDDAIDIGVRRR